MTRIMKEVTQQGADNNLLSPYLSFVLDDCTSFAKVRVRVENIVWVPCGRTTVADLVKSCSLEQVAR